MLKGKLPTVSLQSKACPLHAFLIKHTELKRILEHMETWWLPVKALTTWTLS